MTDRPRARSRRPVLLAEVDLGRILPPRMARLFRLRSTWKSVAGTDLARRLPVLKLEGKVLVVAISDKTWEAVLPRLADRLLPRLRGARGFGAVEEIRGQRVPGDSREALSSPLPPTLRPPAAGKTGLHSTRSPQDAVRRILQIRDKLLP